MKSRLTIFLSMLLLAIGSVDAADRATQVREDKSRIESEGFWIYNDLPQGIELAKQNGKPMLVVIRCIPCQACAGFDARVANRDAQINDLLEKFVCVRIVKANGMDLDLFQFDYDLSFAAFFMNSDLTIYGRFGSRSERKDPERDISIEGFRQTLLAALELHKDYPVNKALFEGKAGTAVEIKTPESYPALRGKYKATLDYEGKVVQSCIHCHQIRDAKRLMLREGRKPVPDKVMYPWPMPDVVGLSLDAGEKATVVDVTKGSPAEAAGFLPGDDIFTLNGQVILSIADVQWVLHNTGATGTLEAKVRRGEQVVNLTLALDEGWRQKSDISWRVSTWNLRRMVLGGMVLEDLPEDLRREAGVPNTALALHVKHVGQYGDHAVAKKAGFLKDDICIAFDGQTSRMTETDLIAYAMRNRMPGEEVTVTVLRDGEQVNLALPMQ